MRVRYNQWIWSIHHSGLLFMCLASLASKQVTASRISSETCYFSAFFLFVRVFYSCSIITFNISIYNITACHLSNFLQIDLSLVFPSSRHEARRHWIKSEKGLVKACPKARPVVCPCAYRWPCVIGHSIIDIYPHEILLHGGRGYRNSSKPWGKWAIVEL